MHLPDFVLLVVGTLAAIAAGLAVATSNYHTARILCWIAAVSFGSLGVVWSATSEGYPLGTQMAVSAVIGAIAAAGLTWGLWEISGKEKAEAPQKTSSPISPTEPAQGGKGGSGEIFGDNGTIIGGKGGKVGLGGLGRGGDGGGGVVHGNGALIIGGEGGSVDGVNIWYPPTQSVLIQFLEQQGQTPDYGVQYPGAGGASAGWLERERVVSKIREAFFIETRQTAKVESSKINDVPLDYINKQLQEAGYPWRARVDNKYWYQYYIP